MKSVGCFDKKKLKMFSRLCTLKKVIFHRKFFWDAKCMSETCENASKLETLSTSGSLNCACKLKTPSNSKQPVQYYVIQ